MLKTFYAYPQRPELGVMDKFTEISSSAKGTTRALNVSIGLCSYAIVVLCFYSIPNIRSQYRDRQE